jgi:lysophospholipase L1-like esterase/dienelactone hydrolase
MLTRCLAVYVISLAIVSSTHAQTTRPEAELPRVLLIGDSVRQGYAPRVAKRLEGRMVVVSPEMNGGDSGSVLAHLDEWIAESKPTVIHFNAGLHDLRSDPATGKHQVEVERYTENLQKIVDRLRQLKNVGVVFANTTPVLDERYNKPQGQTHRHEKDVIQYNAAALAVMQAAGVPVHDLHGIITQEGPEKLLGGDGVHFTGEGYDRLAEAVADCVLRQATIVRFSGALHATAEDAQAYRQKQLARDAQVPAAFRNMKVPPFKVPADKEEWNTRRGNILQTVRATLGDLPARPAPPQARLVSRELRPGYVLERVTLDNAAESPVAALLLIPEKLNAPAPAILWLHSSTPDKDQIVTPGGNGGEEPLGEAFVHAGYVVLAPDACWYGDRAEKVPAGATIAYRRGVSGSGQVAQDQLLKYNLWLGRTLWGMFVHDDQVALDYLCSRKEVAAGRIGVTGMSMGSTRSWWLAAMDERVAAVVGVACMTRYQNLIAHGDLAAHGVYYFVFGLLKHFDTEAVFALIAPRPLLMLTGDLDRGSPADGIEVLERELKGTYAALGAADRFRNVVYPDTAHVYTPQMRAEMLAWFDRWLKPAANGAKGN